MSFRKFQLCEKRLINGRQKYNHGHLKRLTCEQQVEFDDTTHLFWSRLLEMNFILMPSLQHVAVVKIVTTLWSQDEVRNIMIEERLYRDDYNEYCYEAEKRVLENVTKLHLPDFLKRKVKGVVRPIHNEIILWKRYSMEFPFWISIEKLMSNLCWTSEGTVDKKQTGKVLIKDEELEVSVRYELACLYCFESDIPKLWGDLFETEKKSYKLKANCAIHDVLPNWVRFDWIQTVCINEFGYKTPELYPNWQQVFINASKNCNKMAVEYVLQKLTPEEKKQSLEMIANALAGPRKYEDLSSVLPGYDNGYSSDFLIFLLSQMTEEQQMEMFKTYPYTILNSLLDWPKQSFFLQTANKLWDFFPMKYYPGLYEDILDKISIYEDYHYDELFRDFWQQSPMTHKKYLYGKGDLLGELFYFKEESCIKWFLKESTPEQKVKLILCSNGRDTCIRLIENDDWGLLKLFICECITSTNKISKLKKNLVGKLTRDKSYASADNVVKLNNFLKLLEDDICKDAKNKS